MRTKTWRPVGPAVAACLLVAAGAPIVFAAAGPAYAQASAKAVVDGAKARGEVGEQADGLLGMVRGSAGPGVAAAVAEINAGRREVYRQAAAASGDGATAEAAGEAAARQLIARTPAGHYYRNSAGAWVRK